VPLCAELGFIVPNHIDQYHVENRRIITRRRIVSVLWQRGRWRPTDGLEAHAFRQLMVGMCRLLEDRQPRAVYIYHGVTGVRDHAVRKGGRCPKLG
jgi:hypothetical protein